MAVFRVNRNKNYTHMANYHFRDTSLSWKAKGILSNMLSLPDDWDYSLAGLATLASDGMSATRSAIKELEKHGYLVRRPIRENGKIADWEYLIYEKPQLEKQEEKKQVVENQQVENHPQLNTNQSSTKESNTEKIKYIVDYLNQKAEKNFRSTSKATQQHINARLAENFTVEDFKKVIDTMCAKWKGKEMDEYLRPSTLFGPKFENYLNANTGRNDNNGQNAGDSSKTKYSHVV